VFIVQFGYSSYTSSSSTDILYNSFWGLIDAIIRLLMQDALYIGFLLEARDVNM
jgi:hypothetical protein